MATAMMTAEGGRIHAWTVEVGDGVRMAEDYKHTCSPCNDTTVILLQGGRGK